MGRRQDPSPRRPPTASPLPTPTKRQKLFLAITVLSLTMWIVLLVTFAMLF